MAALGMAIGTGNLWRFPRILSQNGGGTFLIPWVLFLFTWSIPLLMVEFALGRSTGRGPVGAFTKAFGKGAAWRGGFVAFCSMGILFYYSVVTGWCIHYVGLAFAGTMETINASNAEQVFVDFTSSWAPAATHVIAIVLALVVVGAGATRGIERVCKVLVPSLFVVLVISAVRGLTLDGADAGVDFLTTVDWGRLATDHRVWLEALTQSAWSTGAGWGLMICYAIYAGNNLASLLAAVAIIPAVFALAPAAGQDPAQLVTQSGPASTGLTFVWVPALFQHMPTGGRLLSIFFFAGLAFAALSSLIALCELAVRTLTDIGLSRRTAVLLTGLLTLVLGLPSAVDLPFIEGHKGLTVLGNQDWVWGLGLMVSGTLLSFSVALSGARRFYEEHIAGPEGHQGKGRLFAFLLTWVVPAQAVTLLGWWFWKAWDEVPVLNEAGAQRSFMDRLADWADPTAVYSIGTCLLQWGLLTAVLLLCNKRLGRVATLDNPADEVVRSPDH
ncbi:MAG: NSS family neurotransmitter:Na+ symporter [Pseudohongiellaceae bacterium]|jgi:NSS family neurotransmitter:Na+ symporter